MKLVRMNKSNGSWQRLESQWRQQCASYDEDFDTYAEASLGTLRDECDNGNPEHDTGVFSLLDQTGENHAVCFLNRASIPGWTGAVLRVRHLVLSPYYDFEALEIEAYASILSHYFNGLILCSDTELIAPNIKIHYRSPYDRTFYATVASNLSSTGRFKTVESKGMWLHLTKA